MMEAVLKQMGQLNLRLMKHESLLRELMSAQAGTAAPAKAKPPPPPLAGSSSASSGSKDQQSGSGPVEQQSSGWLGQQSGPVDQPSGPADQAPTPPSPPPTQVPFKAPPAYLLQAPPPPPLQAMQLVPSGGDWGQHGQPAGAGTWGPPPGMCQTRTVTQWTSLQGAGVSLTYGARYLQPPWPARLFMTVEVSDVRGYQGTSTYCMVCDLKLQGDYSQHMNSGKHLKGVSHIANGANPRAFWMQTLPRKVQELEYQITAYNDDGPKF